MSSDFLCSSNGSRFSPYPWPLPCPLPRVWRIAVGLAWGDILPGWWLPGLRGCSFGHASKGGSREASPQTCSQEKARSGRVRRRPGLPQTQNPAIGAFMELRTTRCFDSQAGWPNLWAHPLCNSPSKRMSHPSFLKVGNRESPPKEGSLALPLSQRLPPVCFLPVGLISLRAELSLSFSESDQIVLVTPLHSGDRAFHGGCC